MAKRPKYTRYKRGGVIEFLDNSDRCNFSLDELTRAALRDVGIFCVRRTNEKIFRLPGLKKLYGKAWKRIIRGKNVACQYWVRSKETDLIVGFKHDTWYGARQELGTHKMKKLRFLTNAVYENISEIVKIESQYLSALEDEAKALSLIEENEYKGGQE